MSIVVNTIVLVESVVISNDSWINALVVKKARITIYNNQLMLWKGRSSKDALYASG